MILRSRHGGDYQARDMFANVGRPPAPGSRAYGHGMGPDDDGPVPAAGRAVRLLCETGGQLPIIVRQGRRGDPTSRPAPDAWEAGVLAQPNMEQTPFDVWSYAIACLLRGGAHFLKLKDRAGRVAEMYVLDPQRVRTYVDGGQVKFKVRDGNTTRTLTRSDVIYVPGFLARSPFIGCSVVANYAMTMNVAAALEGFQSRFFENDATPGGLITVPGNPKKTQRDELRDSWEARHRGNPGSVGILWGGATFESVGISLVDAQFIEAQGFSVEQIARIYGVPVKKLNGETGENPEVENLDFANFSLSPWTSRLEQGLSLDADLFPDRTRHAAFNFAPFLRGTFGARATSYREARQGGWMTANEIRRGEGLDDHPAGDMLQETPVGGAPNSGARTAA